MTTMQRCDRHGQTYMPPTGQCQQCRENTEADRAFNEARAASIRSALAGEEPSRGYAYVTALERERDELKAALSEACTGNTRAHGMIEELRAERDALARKLAKIREAAGE